MGQAPSPRRRQGIGVQLVGQRHLGDFHLDRDERGRQFSPHLGRRRHGHRRHDHQRVADGGSGPGRSPCFHADRPRRHRHPALGPRPRRQPHDLHSGPFRLRGGTGSQAAIVRGRGPSSWRACCRADPGWRPGFPAGRPVPGRVPGENLLRPAQETRRPADRRLIVVGRGPADAQGAPHSRHLRSQFLRPRGGAGGGRRPPARWRCGATRRRTMWARPSIPPVARGRSRAAWPWGWAWR